MANTELNTVSQYLICESCKIDCYTNKIDTRAFKESNFCQDCLERDVERSDRDQEELYSGIYEY